MTASMTVPSRDAAWAEVNKIFPTDYEKDESSSQRAGYDIYRHPTLNYYSRICDLGSRLEVLTGEYGDTVTNIWIVEEKEPEPQKLASEDKEDSTMGNNCSYIIYISKSPEKVEALHKPLLDMKNLHADWRWNISTVQVFEDCRIPPIYHDKGYWATIVEHNNGDWDKAPTYEIHCI